MTEDLERRLEEHNAGKARSTKAYRPFKIIFSEIQPNSVEARKREKFLKSGIGKEFLKKLANLS